MSRKRKSAQRQLLPVHGDLLAAIVRQSGGPKRRRHVGLEDRHQGAEIHAAEIKFARQKRRGVFNRREDFPSSGNRQDSCKSGVSFGEGIDH
jgi:hypothetical protein